MDAKTIDNFESAGGKVAAAIAGLAREDLVWMPPPALGIGLWSISQVVFHLMDDELIWIARIKTIIAEDNPKIMGYDESKFAAKLFYNDQDAYVGAKILELNRKLFASVLRNLPASAFARSGEHRDLGPFTVEQGVIWQAEHLDHHVKYIEMKREALGKPLK
jgi:hypothetical protein